MTDPLWQNTAPDKFFFLWENDTNEKGRKHSLFDTHSLTPTKKKGPKMDLDQPPDFITTSPILKWVKRPPDTHKDKMKWLFKNTTKPKPRMKQKNTGERHMCLASSFPIPFN